MSSDDPFEHADRRAEQLQERASNDPPRAKRYIVWNSARTDGVVFTDRSDAYQCLHQQFGGEHSALGREFAELYGHDEMHLEVLDENSPPNKLEV